MKKSFVFFALGLLLFSSCGKIVQEETEISPKEFEVNLTIRASVDETKTYIEYNGVNGYNPYWKNGDKIHVINSSALGTRKEYTNTAVDGTTANFTGSLSLEAGSHTLYAYYPSSMYANRSEAIYKFSLKSAQTLPSLTSFDPSCDLLIAKPETVEIGEKGSYSPLLDMRFRRVLSVVKIVLTDATTTLSKSLSGKVVKKVTITSSGTDKAYLAGDVKASLITSEVSTWENKSYSVSGSYSGSDFSIDGSNAAYLLVAPNTLPSGSDLTFAVELDDDTYTVSKTITLPSDVVFEEGTVTPLRVSITDACVDVSTAPVIVPVAPSKLNADATDGSFTYSVTNPDGVSTVSAAIKSGDWISNVAASAGTVTFDCTANTGDERTAVITLSYTGAEDVDVTITQKAPGATVDTYLLYVTEGGTVTQTKNGTSTSYFSSVSSKLSCDGTSSNFGVSSFNVKGETRSKAVKVDGSNTPTFTTSTGVSVTVKFYCAGRVSSATPLNLTAAGESTPVVSAALTWTDGKADLYESAVIALDPATTYTFTRGSGNIGLFYVEVIETEL